MSATSTTRIFESMQAVRDGSLGGVNSYIQAPARRAK
jgi:hypothetical protein